MERTTGRCSHNVCIDVAIRLFSDVVWCIFKATAGRKEVDNTTTLIRFSVHRGPCNRFSRAMHGRCLFVKSQQLFTVFNFAQANNIIMLMQCAPTANFILPLSPHVKITNEGKTQSRARLVLHRILPMQCCIAPSKVASKPSKGSHNFSSSLYSRLWLVPKAKVSHERQRQTWWLQQQQQQEPSPSG